VALPPEPDWPERLKGKSIACDGSRSTPLRLTLEQVLDGLPPPGVAASTEAADLAAGFARAAALGATLVLLPPAERRAAATSARVWVSAEEWHRIVDALCTRGIAGPTEQSKIATRDGRPLLNGAFGAVKPRDPLARRRGGAGGPASRPITNLIPPNACRAATQSEAPELPTTSQLNGLALAETEDLPSSGADRKANFYVFRAPGPRRPRTALGAPAPADLVGGQAGASTHVCLKVTGMGWISAAGATTHRRRNMRAWLVYIDNLEIAEVAGKSEAAELKGAAPSPLTEARACREQVGSRGPPGKDIHRVARATALGELVDGMEGIRRPLEGCYLTDGRAGLGAAWNLLLSSALSALCVADLRLKVDHLVAASDASEMAGAEETALIALFDGIGGGRRALEIRGLAPAIHLSFEIDAAAVRAARRAIPSTIHLGDASAADPRDLAKRKRGRGRILRVLVMGGWAASRAKDALRST
ncbi:unnamed protein product, partial [Prorocentrum cordatum]